MKEREREREKCWKQLKDRNFAGWSVFETVDRTTYTLFQTEREISKRERERERERVEIFFQISKFSKYSTRILPSPEYSNFLREREREKT